MRKLSVASKPASLYDTDLKEFTEYAAPVSNNLSQMLLAKLRSMKTSPKKKDLYSFFKFFEGVVSLLHNENFEFCVTKESYFLTRRGKRRPKHEIINYTKFDKFLLIWKIASARDDYVIHFCVYGNRKLPRNAEERKEHIVKLMDRAMRRDRALEIRF